MPGKKTEFEFRIDGYTPETIPMNRLAEYMSNLASLLGEQKSVHFVKIKKGSVRIVHAVEYEAEPKVRERIRSARAGSDEDDDANPMRRINKLLAQDNASGVLWGPEGEILDFPGKKRFTQPQFGPFNQPGTVEGIPICIGGKSDPVPVHLQQPGQPHDICLATREIAREIAPHIFTTLIRAEGIARWHRDSDGKWERDKFAIQSFTVLDHISLTEAVERLRNTPTKLREIDDPLQALAELRKGKRIAG